MVYPWQKQRMEAVNYTQPKQERSDPKKQTRVSFTWNISADGTQICDMASLPTRKMLER